MDELSSFELSFSFGTSKCIYCDNMGYRRLMEHDENGWYHPKCKEDNYRSSKSTIRDIEDFLNGRLKNAEKETF